MENKTKFAGVLHIVGLPHTVVDANYSHCAFTGKVLRFAKMMQGRGWYVVEYSNEGSKSSAKEKIPILSKKDLLEMTKRKSDNEDFSADIHNEVLTTKYWDKVCVALKSRVEDRDIVCHVFGPSQRLVEAAPRCFHVESGIGYTRADGVMPYRIYESSGWMHWHYGKRSLEWGRNYEFVAPNYFDSDDWTVVEKPTGQRYILYFGRITVSKGLDTLVAIAHEMPEKEFLLVGQGDPIPWTSKAKNIRGLPPVSGSDRASLLGNADVVLAPTNFIEPFCGSAVEAQLCGTPVVTSAYGAFWETVEDGVTGYRCNTLADYIGAIRRAPLLDRLTISERARRLYSLESVGRIYDQIFRTISDLKEDGWYSKTSHKFNSIELGENTNNGSQ